MKMEELPENQNINITVRKAQFWIFFLTGVIIFISSFIVYPIVYVQDKNNTLKSNTRIVSDHEERLKNIENLVPMVNEIREQQIEIIKKIEELSLDVKQSNSELLNLYKDYDLKKKK